MTRNESEFLKELALLTQTHGIAIGGCGCCGSPFLYEIDPTKVGEYGYEEQGHAYPGVRWLVGGEEV